MSYTEHPHVREWLTAHDGRVLEERYSRTFHEYLESLPWLPSRIDWSELPHAFVSLEESDAVADLSRIDETPIGCHAYVMVSYRAEEKSILCRTADAFHDADILYMRAPGPRYMCGVRREENSIDLAVQDFAEYDLSGFTVSLINSSFSC